MSNLRSRINTQYETIDHEHEVIFELLDELNAESLKSIEIRRRISGKLCAYVDTHFRHEELLMRAYPKASEHKSSHTVLQDRIVELIEPFMAGTLSGEDAIIAISNPVIHHMLEHDVPFAEWLRTQ